MNTLRRPYSWLAVVILVGVMFTPRWSGAGGLGPTKWFDPHTPQFGDPDGDPGGTPQRFGFFANYILPIRLWTGQVVLIDLTRFGNHLAHVGVRAK